MLDHRRLGGELVWVFVWMRGWAERLTWAWLTLDSDCGVTVSGSPAREGTFDQADQEPCSGKKAGGKKQLADLV